MASLRLRPRNDSLNCRKPCWPMRRTLWVNTMALTEHDGEAEHPDHPARGEPNEQHHQSRQEPERGPLAVAGEILREGGGAEPVGGLGIVGKETLLDLLQYALFVLVQRHLEPSVDAIFAPLATYSNALHILSAARRQPPGDGSPGSPPASRPPLGITRALHAYTVRSEQGGRSDRPVAVAAPNGVDGAGGLCQDRSPWSPPPPARPSRSRRIWWAGSAPISVRFETPTPSSRTPGSDLRPSSRAAARAAIAGASERRSGPLRDRVRVVKSAARTFKVTVRPARPGSSEAARHGVGHFHNLLAELGPVVEVEGIGLLVAYGLDGAVGLDRPLVDAAGQFSQLPAMGPAHGALEHARWHLGQVADRRHSQAAQPGRGGRPDARERLDRQRMEEGQLLAGPNHDDAGARDRPCTLALRLGRFRCQLGQKLRGGHTDRARQPDLTADPGSDGGGDRRRRPEQPLRPVTSRKASSREMPSTRGVKSRNTAWMRWLISA